MITEVHYNWFEWNEGGRNSMPGEAGEYFSVYKVGEKNVLKITEHLPCGPTYPYYHQIEFLDGHSERVFNVNKVMSGPDGF